MFRTHIVGRPSRIQKEVKYFDDHFEKISLQPERIKLKEIIIYFDELSIVGIQASYLTDSKSTIVGETHLGSRASKSLKFAKRTLDPFYGEKITDINTYVENYRINGISITTSRNIKF